MVSGPSVDKHPLRRFTAGLFVSSAPSEAPGRIDGKALSATDAVVWWLPLPLSNLDGYQVSPTGCKTAEALDRVFSRTDSGRGFPGGVPGEVLEEPRGQRGRGQDGVGAQQGEPHPAG